MSNARAIGIWILNLVLLFECGCQTGPTAGRETKTVQMKRVKTAGTRFVDSEGQPIVLRGCNVGNWLLLEMWMLDIQGVADQHEFEAILEKRFGKDRRHSLMETYRENYIRPRDFDIIKSFGFNLVRVPFDYALVEDPEHPGHLHPGGVAWLDRAVRMARDAGLYVILDMHGAPGRQSLDHTTGWSGQNRLWYDEQAQAQMVSLWTELAARYRDETAVMGYDLVNEPFGDGKTENHQPILVALVDRLILAIHTVDTNHVIFAPSTFQGVEFYGKPADRGWVNVAFTEHYYPGIFGSPSTFDSHARFFGRNIPAKAAHLEDVQATLLVGEFNVVLEHLKPAALMRKYYDEYARHGWAATMWSYKLLRKGGGAGGSFWGMVANRDPLPGANIKGSSYEQLASYFALMGTMDYSINEALREQLTTETPEPVELAAQEWFRTPPAMDLIPGWQASDINNARPGGQRQLSSRGMEIYGGGTDIFSNNDQFRLVWAEASGDVRLAARIDFLHDTDKYAKAGVMIRNSVAPDSAHVLLHVFPDGKLVIAWRERDGQPMKEKEIADAGFPVHVELERKDGRITGRYSQDGKTWQSAPLPDAIQLNEDLLVGLAVLSHDKNSSLARAVFEEIDLER